MLGPCLDTSRSARMTAACLDARLDSSDASTRFKKSCNIKYDTIRQAKRVGGGRDFLVLLFVSVDNGWLQTHAQFVFVLS